MRPNRTGVPGLTLRKSGRYALDLPYRKPDGTPARLTKLFPKGMARAAVVAQAKILSKDAQTGEAAKREAAEAQRAGRKTIATLAPDVIGFRKTAGGSPATLAEFESVTNGRIVPGLGALAPHELTSDKLAAFLDELAADGCGPVRIRNVVKVLGQFIKIVRVRGLDPALKTNPVRDAFELGLKVPAAKRRAPVFLTVDEARALVAGKVARAVAKAPRAKHAFPAQPVPLERRTRYALAFLAGLRDGEIAALTWADVAGDVVRVRRALALVGNGKPGETKTEAAKRDVPTHPALVGHLDAWRAAWRERQDRKPLPADPVFPSPHLAAGGELRPYRPPSAKRLRQDLATVGLDRAGITFHATRRSFASWLEAAGVPHETIERLVGHEPKSVLGRHYAATSLDVLRAAVERIAWR